MTEDQHLENLIDAYVLDQLDDGQKKELDALRAQNPGLEARLQERVALKKGIAFQGNQRLRSRLSQLQEEVKEEAGNIKIMPYKKWIAIAATLLLLISAAYFLFPSAIAPTQLYADYYEAYPASFTTRSDTPSPELLEISELYQRKRYASALAKLSPLLGSDESADSQLLLAAGICALETNQLSKARQFLQVIIDNEDPLLSDQAIWYQALSYLKENQSDQAVTLLQQLADRPDADLHREAVALLKKL